MLISVLDKINSLNENVFSYIDNIIEKLPIADWAADAICDSVHLLPLLFLVFIFIEFFEFYYSNKINHWLKKTGQAGIIAGSFASILPQCGFSVMASSLYAKRIITRGTLIAVYLATSDETIPILLATPSKINLILPIIGIKLFIGIFVGLLIDIICPQKIEQQEINIIPEEGCCKHDINHATKRELIIHPIMHTINIFGFILAITLVLNFLLVNFDMETLLSKSTFIQPIIMSFIGLIPNCAISIGITMLLIKGSITFGAAISGLLSNAGLGLLVLLKNNDFKDTVKIILILIIVSSISGVLINMF